MHCGNSKSDIEIRKIKPYKGLEDEKKIIPFPRDVYIKHVRWIAWTKTVSQNKKTTNHIKFKMDSKAVVRRLEPPADLPPSCSLFFIMSHSLKVCLFFTFIWRYQPSWGIRVCREFSVERSLVFFCLSNHLAAGVAFNRWLCHALRGSNSSFYVDSQQYRNVA